MPSWRTLPPAVRLWALFSMHLLAGFLIGSLAASASLSWITGDASQGWPIDLVRFGLAWSSAFIFALPVLLFTHFFPQEKLLLQHVSRRPKWTPVLLVLGMVIVFMPGDDWLYTLNRSFLDQKSLQEISESTKNIVPIFDMPDASDLWMNIAMIGLLAPICEELFYRGAVLSLLTRWMRSIHPAIWITAAISTLMQYQLSAFLPRCIFSAMLGYLFIYGRSLWLPVVAHAANTILSLLFFFFSAKYPVLNDYVSFPYWLGPLSIGAAVTMILLVRSNNPPKLPEPPAEPPVEAEV